MQLSWKHFATIFFLEFRENDWNEVLQLTFMPKAGPGHSQSPSSSPGLLTTMPTWHLDS